MKFIFTIIVVTVVASQPTAAMSSSAAIWDCGKGVTATSSRNALAISFPFGPDRSSPDVDDKTKFQLKGSRHLKWDFRAENKGPEVWLNGKVCKRTN